MRLGTYAHKKFAYTCLDRIVTLERFLTKKMDYLNSYVDSTPIASLPRILLPIINAQVAGVANRPYGMSQP